MVGPETEMTPLIFPPTNSGSALWLVQRLRRHHLSFRLPIIDQRCDMSRDAEVLPYRGGGGDVRLLAVRPGQWAQGTRCWQQERAGQAGTAGTGRNSDRLTEGGGDVLRLSSWFVNC